MIRAARESDAEALMTVINLAFQVERFFLEHDRIDLEGVRKALLSGAFLVVEEKGQIVACVYVEVRGDLGYFGLLSVDPRRQGAGLGRTMIEASEAYCREAGCKLIDLQIVNLREELPALYRKLGYKKTGTASFPADAATKLPCHFIKMSKPL